ncbi:MAG: hypothetical protein WB579_06500 [Bryobacteraceae bacterium]
MSFLFLESEDGGRNDLWCQFDWHVGFLRNNHVSAIASVRIDDNSSCRIGQVPYPSEPTSPQVADDPNWYADGAGLTARFERAILRA